MCFYLVIFNRQKGLGGSKGTLQERQVPVRG